MTSITSMRASGGRDSGPQPYRPTTVDDKLQIPQPSFPVLRRGRITRLISAASCHRVTVVCAPPGSGKTVACASWAGDRRGDERIVWISLGADDRREWFWAYVCAGLRRAGVQPAEVIQSLEDVPATAFPLRLVGAAQWFSQPVVLVLDNVHEVADNTLLDGLAFLIHHGPAALRLVLAGRRMPARLQLARLPVSDVAGIGPRQLALTATEAVALASAG
jgi:LuxR family transcriptional regulator, maltose regulon positive regulatory protein